MKKTIPAILVFLLLAVPAAVQGQSPLSVTLAWDPSVGATNVAGYYIYWGGTTGNYTNRIDAGLATNGVVSNLLAGGTYYFAATAYTSSGLQSGYSSEVVWQCPQLSLSLSTSAAQAQYTWSTNADNTLTIIGYTGPGGAVTIPSSINYLLVTTIGSAFAGCTNLTSVTIPGSVTSIGDFAFMGCGSLTNVTLANGVTSIGTASFAECASLASVTLANGVTSIGDFAFFGCGSLTNVTLANGVTSIGTASFAACASLASVTIPCSVTNIIDFAFGQCASLTSVYFAGNAPATDSTAFLFDNNVTAYYLPGTTGWDDFSANTGLPAVLWNPLIQTGDGSFGVQNNQFGFNITGTTNIPILVEACTDLTSPVWIPLQTLTLTYGSFYFSDPQWTNYPGRYYRISSP